jgi:hypothetical protein
MYEGYETSAATSGRALIIGKTDRRIDLLQYHLAEYFSEVDLISDLGHLNSLTADNLTVIVVTDTLGDGLNQDFFENLRSLYPRARLLCLFDRISRQTEKTMRSAGLLFLGSYEHFDDCYGSVLERVSGPQKANQHQPYQTSDKPRKARGTAKGFKEKRPDRCFASHRNARFEDRMGG